MISEKWQSGDATEVTCHESYKSKKGGDQLTAQPQVEIWDNTTAITCLKLSAVANATQYTHRGRRPY